MNLTVIKSEDQREILCILEKIYSEFNNRNFEYSKFSPGLLNGKAGIILFLMYYSRLKDNQKSYDLGIELLSSVFDDLNNGFNYHTHASGLAGIAFVIELLNKEGFVKINSKSFYNDIDSFMAVQLKNELKNNNLDFLHGSTGIAMYFIKSALFRRLNYEILENFIDELEEKSICDNQGTRWVSILDYKKNFHGLNLSLSHGISSIIIILSKIYKLGISKEKTFNMLANSVKFLLNQKATDSKNISLFPSWVSNENTHKKSRLGWCYGDLGNALALWISGQATNNKHWQQVAVEISLHSTTRKDYSETYINDAGFCHGACGVAHIFNRFYKFTGIDLFSDAAAFWYKETIKMSKFNGGLAGYKTWNGGNEKWVNNYGFLEGVSGIGLSFINILSNDNPVWDECLLIS